MKNSKQPTAMQKLFIREYCLDLNATRAAIAAGYSEKGAAQAGARLLTNVKVSSEIAKLTQKTCAKLEISAEKVLQELARLAFLDPRKFYNENGGLKHVTELDDDTAACLAGMEVREIGGDDEEKQPTVFCRKIKFADKGANLERLGRHLKLFTDKVEHSGQIEQVDFSRLTDAQLEEIQRIVESADSDPRRRSE
jgi:phage terminase small subunit